MKAIDLSAGAFMGYWLVAVASAPTLYLHLWKGSHVLLEWELEEGGDGEMVLQVAIEWVWVDMVGKVWLCREGEMGEWRDGWSG